MTDCDVLIAGLGPVGATLAALLGQNGLSVIVIEADSEIYSLPRAAHIDHEIMRIFQTIGIAGAIAPHVRPAPDYEFRNASDALLMRVERAGRLGISGWPVSFNIHQPGIERVLWDRLRELSCVRVVRGSRFSGLLDNELERVVVRADENGAVARYTARYLVGCDGARSAVREACGSGLQDFGFDEPWLVVDAQTDDERGFPPMNIQLCDPARPTSFVHTGPGRLRWEFMLKPGESADAMKNGEAVEFLLAPWRRFGAFSVERSAVYRFHGLVARTWRRGRVFLAGDAAHQMPPFMGQGLCSGLRDAANLAWKLCAGGNGLLDTYQTEREPHVAFVVGKAIEMGRIVCTLDAHSAATRDTRMLSDPISAPPALFPPLAQGCFMHGTPGAGTIFPQVHETDMSGRARYSDDCLPEGSWLFHDGPAPRGSSRRGIEVISAGAFAPAKDWLNEHRVEAVLVRPDRIVFGAGAAPELLDAYATWLT